MNTVTWQDWNVGSTSDGHKCVAQPFRVLNGKYLHGSMYGCEFTNADAAHAAMREHGYTQDYFRRNSVVHTTFKHLDFCQEAARFDALYRYWKFLVRVGCDRCAKALEAKLAKLAKRVGIFHPATRKWRGK